MLKSLLAALAILLLASNVLHAQEELVVHRDGDTGYQFTYPSTWQQMGPDEIAEFNRRLDALGFPGEYIAGYRKGATAEPEIGDYFLVQKLSHRSMGLDHQLFPEEIQEFIVTLENGSIERQLKPTGDQIGIEMNIGLPELTNEYDDEGKRFMYFSRIVNENGNILFLGTQYAFGRRYDVQILYYTIHAQELRPETTARSVLQSLQLDEGVRWDEKHLANRNILALTRMGKSVLLWGFIGAALGLIPWGLGKLAKRDQNDS